MEVRPTVWWPPLQVLVDGKDIKSLQLKWLRGQTGIVNQVCDRLTLLGMLQISL